MDLDKIEAELRRGPQGGEPENNVPQYQAWIGVEDALALVAECKSFRARLAEAEKDMKDLSQAWEDERESNSLLASKALKLEARVRELEAIVAIAREWKTDLDNGNDILASESADLLMAALEPSGEGGEDDE